MNRVFNKYIEYPKCLHGKCMNGWVIDKFNNILEVNGKQVRCDCYFTNRYIDANIGKAYWDLNLDNFEGAASDRDQIADFIERIPEFHKTGDGFYIHGTNGSGKTSMSIIFLKSVLDRTKVSAMFAPFADLVILNSRIIGGFNDKEALHDINIIKNVGFLVLDDIGKEFDSGKDYTRATLNSILRYRDMWNLPTIYTANSPIEDLKTHYGDSNFSIMYGRSHILTMEFDQDYRKIKKHLS